MTLIIFLSLTIFAAFMAVALCLVVAYATEIVAMFRAPSCPGGARIVIRLDSDTFDRFKKLDEAMKRAGITTAQMEQAYRKAD